MNTEPRIEPDGDTAPMLRENEAREDNSPSLSSDTLLRGQRAVTITHNGALYRLQTTRQGKLILTK